MRGSVGADDNREFGDWGVLGPGGEGGAMWRTKAWTLLRYVYVYVESKRGFGDWGVGAVGVSGLDWTWALSMGGDGAGTPFAGGGDCGVSLSVWGATVVLGGGFVTWAVGRRSRGTGWRVDGVDG